MRIIFDALPQHWHAIPSQTNDDPQKVIPLQGQGTSVGAGVSDIAARDNATAPPQKALTFVDDLEIYFGQDINNLRRITDGVLTQLRAAQPGINWNRLGDGGSGHALANQGSGEIKLHYLSGINFAAGEYIIELRVKSGGGRIHFNLYVE